MREGACSPRFDLGCLGPSRTGGRGTLRVNSSGPVSRLEVTGDGAGLVSQAGGLLLVETARVTGLAAGLSAVLRPWRRPRAVHDPGKIAFDLGVSLAFGGDCLA